MHLRFEDLIGIKMKKKRRKNYFGSEAPIR